MKRALHAANLSFALAPVKARGPSLERALHRGPNYQLASALQAVKLSLPSVPFAHLHGARPKRASVLLAFLLNLPPLWRAVRAGQLIIALLLHIARGPSWPAYHLRGPSGPVCHLPFMPDLRHSPLHVKSAPRTGRRLIILSRMVTHIVASTPKTTKCACVANKVNSYFDILHRDLTENNLTALPDGWLPRKSKLQYL